MSRPPNEPAEGAASPAPDAGPDAADATLDAIILAAAPDAWTKVAVFIARVVDAARAAGSPATGQAIAARIYVLVEAGRLEAQGNVRRWRAASVRKGEGQSLPEAADA